MKRSRDEARTLTVSAGDHQPAMKGVADNLTSALKHAANDTQRQMLKHYISHFSTGNIADHKNSQRFWVQDKVCWLATICR